MRLMSAIFGKILLMPHAASHRPNIDQVRSAVASMGGASPVLELLLAELEATREERDSLRKEKHSNTLEIERLSLLLEKFKRLLFGRKSEKLLRQIEQLELELEEAYINEGKRCIYPIIPRQPDSWLNPGHGYSTATRPQFHRLFLPAAGVPARSAATHRVRDHWLLPSAATSTTPHWHAPRRECH